MAAIIKRTRKSAGKRETYYAIKYRDHNGKQVWRAGYTDREETRALARRLEDEARKIRLGDIDPQAEARRIERSKRIADQIAQYKYKLEAAGRSDGHIAYTIADVEALVEFAAADGSPLTTASDISWPLIDRWVKSQRNAQANDIRGNSNKTINRRVSSVQQFLRYLAEIGGITAYPLNRYPKLPTGEGYRTRDPRALTRDERDKLLLGETTPQPRRDLYTFVSQTGLRLNEARHVSPSCFDWEHRLLVLPAHVTKAGKRTGRPDVVPLHDDIFALAKKLCEGQPADARLFPRIPTRQHVINQLRRDCEAAGVNPGGIGFHSLRHTFCTLLARANVHPALLQKLARHADLKTTLRFYTHLQREDERAAIQKL